MSPTTTSAQILRHTAAFLSETLTQPDLRRHLTSIFLKTLPSNLINPLNFAHQTIETAISTTSPSLRSSSLRLAEKLLHSNPTTSFSSFLLSLIYHLSHRPIEAGLCLLRVFQSDPSFSRSEMAPLLFQELFLAHFGPILKWYNQRRSCILSSQPLTCGYDSDREDRSFVSAMAVLSKMSADQALAVRNLEKDYQILLDENCRIFCLYFMEVLKNRGGDEVIVPPMVVLSKNGTESDDNGDSCNGVDQNLQTRRFESTNGRYNPMWDGGDELVINRVKSLSKFPSLFPVRVSPQILTNQELDTTAANYIDETSQKENIKDFSLFDPMEDLDNVNGGSRPHMTPPKDFVCPITTHVFEDPVTLETGQTYERRAIKEWIDRGNSTCPITRQNLHTTQIPKTNYVLKRLIASWRDKNPSSVGVDMVLKPAVRAVSPKSVISQATIDGAMGELRVAITEVCTSEILREAEMGVIKIERIWREMNREVGMMQSMLSKPAVINGFVEILLNSMDVQVLRAAVVLLTELGSRGEAVVHTLTRVDSDVECIVELFKNGLVEAVVLLHLINPSAKTLVEMNLVDHLLELLSGKLDEGCEVKMCMEPRVAVVLLVSQIVRSCSEDHLMEIVRRVVSSRGFEKIVDSLEGEQVEERMGAVSVLLRCILEDGKCRNMIAEKAELAPLLEIFLVVNDEERFEIVHFLSELVKLNRRSLNEQILHVLKEEGGFSTMHILLLYLQNAHLDHSPVVAGLLLQLDLLDEPRKMSIYREESIDTLISCLRNSEYPVAQITAAEVVLSLQGCFSYSGKSLSRAILLKRAGFDRSYRAFMRKDQRRHNQSAEAMDKMEDEKAAQEWERKVAFVLVSHEFGLLFEALAEGLKSNYKELQSVCFMIATWLVHMLSVLPDTGIRGAARVCLLNHFVSIFKTEKNTEERALSMLGLNSFIRDPEGLQDLAGHMKDILKGLRELKKSSAMAYEMLKVFSKEHENSADLWNHEELSTEDCSINGEVLTIACFKGRIFSGHSDGMIKVWITGDDEQLHLIQEIHEHTKAVTSLAVQHSCEKLYSGSLDRTVRVWIVTEEGIYCEQVEEMKDQINSLVVANSLACYIPQGAGVKVHSWNGSSKVVNQHKYAKSLALVQGRLYCGCQDNSIQEIDLATGTVGNIQTGSKKLLGKANPVYALQVDEGELYAGGPSLDGSSVKIWSTSNYSMVGSLTSTLDVRAICVSSELVYLGGKVGSIEVWCKKKHSRVETLQTSSTARILCMAFDTNQDILLVGTSDGKIQTWELS